eukprot:CAMPEP_0204379934 /NCGR_PEP_ID=MMETSP0469-20131031/52978_1 /ASSEMBLY_ACC=CAM_ASM_000384 /TAXON_ID=2969 /ORGANISM="Oxyrrhis marina" /LENGTH=53 /DNA_ID=CAMNT_0051371479 /DNA_START=26 /DNA_END=184 /DNA_ORIENTATION=+
MDAHQAVLGLATPRCAEGDAPVDRAPKPQPRLGPTGAHCRQPSFDSSTLSACS